MRDMESPKAIPDPATLPVPDRPDKANRKAAALRPPREEAEDDFTAHIMACPRLPQAVM